MKELIISIYDSGCEFTIVILKNDEVIYNSNNLKDLRKYKLVNEEWNLFDRKAINEYNADITQFNRIIICEDGDIEIYSKLFDCYGDFIWEKIR